MNKSKKTKNEFIRNDFGVVTNPNIPFRIQARKALGWDFVEIKTGIAENGLWAYGVWYPGGASPCSIGRYHTEAEAILAAINDLKYYLNDNGNFVPEANMQLYRSALDRYTTSFLAQNPHLSYELPAGTQLAIF